MVGTIAPLVQAVIEKGQRLGPIRVLSLHVASTLAGGLALGLAIGSLRLGLAAAAPQVSDGLAAWGPAVLAAAALYLVLAVAVVPLPLPMLSHQQVPMQWRTRMGPERASLAYGFVLGTGVLTRINSPAFYLVPVALLVSPSPALALAAAGCYALARGGIVAGLSLATRREQLANPEDVMGRGVAQRQVLVTLQMMLLVGLVVAGTRVLLGSVA